MPLLSTPRVHADTRALHIEPLPPGRTPTSITAVHRPPAGGQGPLPSRVHGLAIETPPQGVDYSRKWYVLVAIAMAIFLGTIDGSIVNVALPTLAEEFDTTFGVAQWVVLAYLLTQATLTLGFGRLGDMIGKKPIFTAGFAVFTFGSVLAGLSPTIGFLIAARVVQALGAAMIFALGFAITTEAFPPSERGKALGINGTTVSLGIMAGPILGGMILEATDWRWIFFVNLPIGIIGTITAIKFVPNTKPKGKQRFDFAGAVSFFVALLSLLLALTMGQNVGFTDPSILAAFGLSAIAFVAFVVIEQRVTQPMLNLDLFRSRDLTVNLITGFVSFFALSGLLLVVPFYLTDVVYLSPREIGLVLGAVPITMGIVAPLSGSLSDRVGIKTGHRRRAGVDDDRIWDRGIVDRRRNDVTRRGRRRSHHRARDGDLPVAEQLGHPRFGPARPTRRHLRHVDHQPNHRECHRHRGVGHVVGCPHCGLRWSRRCRRRSRRRPGRRPGRYDVRRDDPGRGCPATGSVGLAHREQGVIPIQPADVRGERCGRPRGR